PNKNDKHLKPIQSLPNTWKDKDISYQHIPLDTYDEDDDDKFNPREQNGSQNSLKDLKSENKEVSNGREENGDQGSEISTSSSEAYEDAAKPTTMTTVIDVNIDSIFISPELYQCLQSAIPNIVKGCQWVLLYSTVKHGISLRTLIRKSADLSGPSLLITGDTQGAVFGGLVNCPLNPTPKRKYQGSTVKHGISLRTLIRKSADLSGPSLLITGDTQGAVFGGLVNCPLNPTPKRKYQGTYETFVFTTLYGAPRLFRPTGANRYFYMCLNNLLALGGGGNFALCLDEDLLNGTSGRCDTFGNQCLA
nr:hypothetical protein [Tanacetum cinerariifolium]